MNEHARIFMNFRTFTCFRFYRCIVIVRKKMQLVYFAWILVPKRLLLRWDCISLKVDVNMK